MFIIGKEAQAQLTFLKRCSLCAHSALHDNVVDCTKQGISSLSVYRELEHPVYEDRKGVARRSPVKEHCQHFHQEDAYTLD